MSDARTPHDLQQFLDKQQLTAELLRDIGETPTVPAAAAALGVSPEQIIKTLLFLVQQPTDTAPQPVVVISHGERLVDKKTLARHFGVGGKKVKLAPADVVLDLLGYPAGGVPPVGHKTALPVILDASVVAAAASFGGVVYGGGGDDRTMLRISLASLVAFLQPTEVAVSS
jgi:prolyl-tRNA editing enzyme YbaK/EbsC (Cys-tRNA(Pro) deacylase)